MIVFDLDDTLYKEREYVSSSFRAIAREAERRGILTYAEALSVLCGAPDGAAAFSGLAAEIAARAPGCGMTEEWMVNTYRTHTPEIALPAETVQLLDWLAARGVRMGLITDGRSNTQRAKIKALGLERYISPENMLISGETGYDKHHREPFGMLMERNPDEAEFVYVGDNPAKDFLWPNRMGWLTVQVDDSAGLNIHTQPVTAAGDYGPQLHIKEIGSLPEAIGLCRK